MIEKIKSKRRIKQPESLPDIKDKSDFEKHVCYLVNVGLMIFR